MTPAIISTTTALTIAAAGCARPRTIAMNMAVRTASVSTACQPMSGAT